MAPKVPDGITRFLAERAKGRDLDHPECSAAYDLAMSQLRAMKAKELDYWIAYLDGKGWEREWTIDGLKRWHKPVGAEKATHYPTAQAPALPAGGGIFSARPVRDLIAEMEAHGGLETEWVIPDYVPKAGFVIVAGTPKDGKSTLVAHLAVAVASGATFLGRTAKRGKVLWLGLDEHPRLSLQRFKHLGAPEGIFFKGAPFRSSPLALNSLAEWIAQEGVVLVVVDTLSKIWAVEDENAAAQVDTELDALLCLARGSEAAILLIHHTRKDGTDIRGSSAILGNADVAITLKPGDGQRRTLEAKSRFDTPARLEIERTPDGYRVFEAAPGASDQSRLLAAMREEPESAAAIAERVNIPETTTQRALRELAKGGRIKLYPGKGTKRSPERYSLLQDYPTTSLLSGGVVGESTLPKTADEIRRVVEKWPEESRAAYHDAVARLDVRGKTPDAIALEAYQEVRDASH